MHSAPYWVAAGIAVLGVELVRQCARNADEDRDEGRPPRAVNAWLLAGVGLIVTGLAVAAPAQTAQSRRPGEPAILSAAPASRAFGAPQRPRVAPLPPRPKAKHRRQHYAAH